MAYRSCASELDISGGGAGTLGRDFSLLLLLLPLVGVGVVDGAGPDLLAGSFGVDEVDDDGGADVGEAAAGESPPAGVANSSSLWRERERERERERFSILFNAFELTITITSGSGLVKPPPKVPNSCRHRRRR